MIATDEAWRKTGERLSAEQIDAIYAAAYNRGLQDATRAVMGVLTTFGFKQRCLDAIEALHRKGPA
jgi:hypothetical protein